MKKVNIEALKAKNDYLSFCLKNIRLQLKADKKILAESQEKYDDLYETYGEELSAPELSTRFVERLSLKKDKKYINFANSLVKKHYPAYKIDEIVSNLMLYPDFIERLENQKKKIGKKYYKNLVKINKYSR
ncbi:hypothetical protein HDR60_02800 [bacterium]|nr:hypothetical protein [bacterium]